MIVRLDPTLSPETQSASFQMSRMAAEVEQDANCEDGRDVMSLRRRPGRAEIWRRW